MGLLLGEESGQMRAQAPTPMLDGPRRCSPTAVELGALPRGGPGPMLAIGGDAGRTMVTQMGAVVVGSPRGMSVQKAASLRPDGCFFRGIVEIHRIAFREQLVVPDYRVQVLAPAR